MILFVSSGRVNSTIIDNIDFIGADLNSYPIYLILANGINGLLSCSNSFLTLLNFVISIDLIRILCAIILYIRTRIEAMFLILSN